MTFDEWNDLNSGDVLQHRDSGETYIVSDADEDNDGPVIVLSRVIVARNPQEWTRMRKTVDTEELIQREAERAAAFAKQSKSQNSEGR